jgi:transposase-like protein
MRKMQKKADDVQGPAAVYELSGGDRREPITAPMSSPAVIPVGLDPEVLAERPKRRRFTAEYKRRILAQHDACTRPGEVGAMLRREGLYSSQLCKWQRQCDAALDAGLTPKKRGRKVRVVDELAARNAKLEKMNRRLEERLRKAEIIIDVQKKLSILLGIPLADTETGENE